MKDDDFIVERERDVIRWALEREIVAPIEDPADFKRHAHRLIWAVVLANRSQSKSVGYPASRAELQRRNQLEDVGEGYLLEVSSDSVRPSDLAVVTAAQEIQRAAQGRRVRATLSRYVTADEIDIDRLAADIASIQNAERPQPPLLDDVAVLTQPSADFLVHPAYPDRGLIALIGPSGVGKTFEAINTSLSIASGRAWHGHPVLRRGPVVYIQAEGAAGPRIGAWKLAHEYDIYTPLGLHTWSGSVNLLDPVAVAGFIAAVKPLQPVLVVWDTLARCFIGGDENSARDVGVAIAALDRVKVQLQAAQMVLHHMNKSGGSERGSTALRGACDTVLFLQQADDILQLTCEKQKDAEPFQPISLALTPAYPGAGSCVMRLAGDVLSNEELSDSQGKVLHALTELFGQVGATAAELEAAVPTIHRASYYRARARLIERGFIRHDENQRRFYPTGKTPVAANRTAVAQPSQVKSQRVA